MSFAGVVLACWLAIAAIAFLALSALARATARGDTEANLGIVGNAELRMLLGERDEDPRSLEARLSRLGIPSAHRAGDPRRRSPATTHWAASRQLDGGREPASAWESVGSVGTASYTR